mmetsp:Transcript_17367/g.46157  ORF Transcript_17367/g.46157 Transcript_17367/m.46157 type:complete len:238 (-) Transcript_17367:14-727(-)
MHRRSKIIQAKMTAPLLTAYTTASEACPTCTQRWLPQAIRRGLLGRRITCRKDSVVANMKASSRFTKDSVAPSAPGLKTETTGWLPSEDVSPFQRTHCPLGPSTGSQPSSVASATRCSISTITSSWTKNSLARGLTWRSHSLASAAHSSPLRSWRAGSPSGSLGRAPAPAARLPTARPSGTTASPKSAVNRLLEHMRHLAMALCCAAGAPRPRQRERPSGTLIARAPPAWVGTVRPP